MMMLPSANSKSKAIHPSKKTTKNDDHDGGSNDQEGRGHGGPSSLQEDEKRR
jgi:hypothetical protein